MKTEKELEELKGEQLGLIDHVDRKLGNYRTPSGWGVDGNLNRITRYHKNVDLMIPITNLQLTKKILREYGMDVTGDEYRLHAEKGDLKADVIVWKLSERKDLNRGKYADFVEFVTPYHGKTTVPQEFLYGVNAELEGVKFDALNYFALLAAKSFATAETADWAVERDRFDTGNLLEHLNKELKDMSKLKLYKKMMTFARPATRVMCHR